MTTSHMPSGSERDDEGTSGGPLSAPEQPSFAQAPRSPDAEDSLRPRRLKGRPELRHLDGVWWVRGLCYLGLAVLAAADAVGFSNTLTTINRGQQVLWTVFTVALTIGAVWGAHEVGRMTRARREGRDGHPSWIVAVAVIWMGIGIVIAWLRAGQDVTQQPDVESALGPVTTADPNSPKIALLLLILYLITGALSATTAYRFAHTRSRGPAMFVRWRRNRAQRRANRASHQRSLAEGTRERIAAERQRLEDAHGDWIDDATGEGELNKESARLYIGTKITGGPAEFDGLMRS